MGTVLNISVPTFNRPDFLLKCLNSIRDAVLNLEMEDRSLVSVFISDNSSTDLSKHVAESLFFKDLRIVYKKNSDNIGSDRNIAQCYLYDQAKFVMILGDDDFLSKNSLKILMPLLKKGDYSIYFLRAYGLTTNELDSRDEFVRTMRVFNSMKEVVLERNIDLTFISIMIFKRSDYTEKEVQEGIGTNLVQLNLVLKLLRKCKGESLFVDANLVMATRNNTGGYDPVTVFVQNYFDLLFDNFDGEINSVLPGLRTRMIHSFYNRSIAQYMRRMKTPLSSESLLVLDSFYSSMLLYKVFYRPLFRSNNLASFYLLSSAYVIGNVLYKRGPKISDFWYHLTQFVKLLFKQ